MEQEAISYLLVEKARDGNWLRVSNGAIRFVFDRGG
jgi:hypothetical protein